MTLVTLPRDVTLRSTDATWTAADWEGLPHDGQRYEIIDGVLYVSTAPSLFHQWIIQEIYAALRQQLAIPGIGFVFLAPVGVFMPGCDPVQPDLVVHALRSADHSVDDGPRIGLVVSKAVGNAVQRHRVARRLRHVARTVLNELDAADRVVIRALPSSRYAISARLEQELRTALRRTWPEHKASR